MNLLWHYPINRAYIDTRYTAKIVNKAAGYWSATAIGEAFFCMQEATNMASNPIEKSEMVNVFWQKAILVEASSGNSLL